MPPRKKPGQVTPPGMTSTRDLHGTLWKAADKLRGSMDAAQYRDFVLGLVFLKYVSDSFAEHREQIRADALTGAAGEERAGAAREPRAGALPGGVGEYEREDVFWVPEAARWDVLAQQAHDGSPGEVIDAAMDSIMNANSALTGALPKIFSRDGVDQHRLAELVDLIGDARFTGHGSRPARDVLGEVYEYFLDNFARAEGRRGGEFYTPASVVRLLVGVLEPYSGQVYDPCCGSGGMFVQAEKFVLAHRGRRGDITVCGQESNQRTWRLARMNLAIHGIRGDLGTRWADTFREDRHPDVKADFILANPPFNMSGWARTADDPRWRFGVPPAGNANFAWLQHMLHKLADRGTAGVVLANGSMSSRQSGEGGIRAAMVEADLVACMVALPPQLFRTVQIPACLWFLARDKSAQGARNLADRRGQVLFIDARSMGVLASRAERVLTDEEIGRIAGTYHAWRGTASATASGLRYEDVRGFCRSAAIEQIREHGHVLTPGRYVGPAETAAGDGEPFADRVERLTRELLAHFAESARLEQAVRAGLDRLDV